MGWIILYTLEFLEDWWAEAVPAGALLPCDALFKLSISETRPDLGRFTPHDPIRVRTLPCLDRLVMVSIPRPGSISPSQAVAN